jgi:uncharacterized RDD family membrane protein YckC
VTPRYAGLVSRGAARLVDMALLAVLVGSTGWLAQQFLGGDAVGCTPAQSWWQVRRHLCQFIPYVIPLAAVWFPALYYVLFWTTAGKTPGMALLGLRLLRSDGGKVGPVTALKRFLAVTLSMVTFGVGFLMVLVTERRRTLHDLLARTVVVYDWGEAARARADRIVAG